MRRLVDLGAPGLVLACCLAFAGQAGAATKPAAAASAAPAPAAAAAAPAAPQAPPAPAAPPAVAAAPAPAGASLRQQVEAHFEVLPLSDGVLLRPRQPMGGIQALEVRDGDLAIDGHGAEIEELERRVGAEPAAPVRRLLELDGDELRTMFGFTAAEPPAPPAPAVPGAPDTDALQERIQAEMEARRAEVDQQRDALRQRIEQEMAQHTGDTEQLRAQLRTLEREARRHHGHSGDAKVAFGWVNVPKGDTSGDIVAIGGSIRADGDVLGNSVAIGGPVYIGGLANGSVVSVGGDVHLGPEARVSEDVVSVGGQVIRDPGAEVAGDVTEVSMWEGLAGLGPHLGPRQWPHGDYFDGALLRLLRCFIVVTVLLLLGALIAVIARHPLERVSEAAAAEPWKSGVVGALAIVLFAPAIALVAVLLAVSIVGIPLLLLWPFMVLGCVVAAFFGYMGAAHSLAVWSERRFGWRLQGPVTTLVLGLFLLHGSWMMARLIDVVDGPQDVAGFLRVLLLLFFMLLNLCALAVGIGGVILARRRARGMGGVVLPPAPPLPPSPAPFAAPSFETSTAVTSTTKSAAPPAAVVPPPPPPEATAVHDVEPIAHEGGAWEEPFAGFDEPAGEHGSGE